MGILAAAYSDIGTRKGINQDSYLLRVAQTGAGDVVFAAVCDGMGGLDQGEFASASVVLAFAGWFDSELPELAMDAVFANDFGYVVRRWEEIVREQNAALLSRGAQRGANIGTTLTALFAASGVGMLLAHVGDSRAYRFGADGAGLELMTEDHTFVARETQAGRMTEEDARRDERRNVLTQCIGVNDYVNPLYVRSMADPAGEYLLCTDGFRHEVDEAEIYERLSGKSAQGEGAMREALAGLASECMARGEADNITALMLGIGGASA